MEGCASLRLSKCSLLCCPLESYPRAASLPAAVPSGRNTRFWEGGAGCRDPRRLNRNDARKHRGSRLKTQSRKQSRVGEKGAEQRDARAQRGGHGAG